LSFVVDRPFRMEILDADDAVLFLGQVTDPR
jgi:serine protease inhibitor